MKKKGLIVALDVDSPAEAKALVRRIGDAVDFYKVAPSLYFQDPGIVSWLRERAKKVFLDFKWYDIPSQTARSVRAAGRMGVAACTIHASAGSAVMKAVLSVRPRPRVWGVTVLTSLSGPELKETGVPSSPPDQVLRLAALAQARGLDGLVCSPQEISLLRRNGIRSTLVTPGIQWGGGGGGDQKRTASPRQAWADGADHIVVGRAILEAENPAEAALRILDERPSPRPAGRAAKKP
ncbi:MAG: orotidine-5'-phosphate decarboxylase [Elusimicrobiota bacterium]